LTDLISLEDGLGFSQQEIFELNKTYLNPGLTELMALLELNINFVRSDGTVIWDEDGNEYLDFVSGYGTLNLGHNPRVVLDAIERVKGLPVLIHNAPSILAGVLAHNLAQVTPGDLQRCFFCNSTAEAVEAALKLARAATGRPRLVYCDNAMHGKTLGALSVSGGECFTSPFQPLLPECQKVPYGDTVALEMVLRDERAACFLLEPIQVEGGVIIPDEGYLRKIREICSRYGTLLIVDESRTGLGRCGEIFACMREEIDPDVICLPGFLGGGVFPVGGFITTAEIWDRAYGGVEKCLLHSSGFGGNVLAMAAAITVLQEVIDQDLSGHARGKGAYLMQRLKELARDNGMIKNVRGSGLLLGIEFSPLSQSAREALADESAAIPGEDFPASLVISKLFKKHRIISAFTDNDPNVLRIEPPLTVTREQLDQFVEALDDTLKSMSRSKTATVTAPAVTTSFLIVAHDDAFAPWSFLQEGDSVGAGVDLFKELGKRSNIMIKFIGATKTHIFPLLASKQIDLFINAGWPNPAFDDYPVIASDPYAQFEAHLFMKRDSTEPRVSFRLEDTKGRKVGTQRAGVASSNLKQVGAEVLEYDNDTLSFLDHFWNKTDFVSAEKMVGLNLNHTYFQGCFQIVSEPINKQNVVCLAHKDNVRLIQLLNEEIAKLKSAGVVDEIINKYSEFRETGKVEPHIRAIKNP
jgi:putrescine aminotransferase